MKFLKSITKLLIDLSIELQLKNPGLREQDRERLLTARRRLYGRTR